MSQQTLPEPGQLTDWLLLIGGILLVVGLVGTWLCFWFCRRRATRTQELCPQSVDAGVYYLSGTNESACVLTGWTQRQAF